MTRCHDTEAVHSTGALGWDRYPGGQAVSKLSLSLPRAGGKLSRAGEQPQDGMVGAHEAYPSLGAVAWGFTNMNVHMNCPWRWQKCRSYSVALDSVFPICCQVTDARLCAR